MGCASGKNHVNVKPFNQENLRKASQMLENVKCRRHVANTVSHYNMKTKELICGSCYAQLTVKIQRDVPSVTDYVQSIGYKQRFTRVKDRTRNLQSTKETFQKNLEQVESNLEATRKEFKTEVNSFVSSLISLLNHLKDDFLKSIDTQFDWSQQDICKTLNLNLKMMSVIKEKYVNLNKYDQLSQARNFHEASAILCLNSTESYLDSIKETRPSNDYVPSLKFNKTLTLGEILGNYNGKTKIKLGTLSINSSYRQLTPAVGYDIDSNPETADDLSEQSTTSTPEHGIARNLSRLSSKPRGQSGSQFVSSEHGTLPSRSVSRGSRTPSRAASSLSKRSKTPLANGHPPVAQDTSAKIDTADEVLDVTDIENQELPTIDMNKRRNQFQRENDVISRQPSRRVSFVETPRDGRNTLKTSRLSTQSGLSPSKLDTPRFISPRGGEIVIGNSELGSVQLMKRIELKKDTHIRNITSTAFLPNGSIILCDSKNKKLLLLNDELRQMDAIQLQSNPHDVTTVSDSSVAVTLPQMNIIIIIDIIENHFCDQIERIQSSPNCMGVGYVDGHILYTSGNDVFLINHAEVGGRTSKFENAFRKPISIFSKFDREDILVTCYGVKENRGEIVNIGYEGKPVNFVSSCSEITRPVNATIDSSGYIYVCDIKPPSIHQLRPDGQYCRKMLGESDGKFQHVNFLQGKNKFIATENDCDYVKMYAIE